MSPQSLSSHRPARFYDAYILDIDGTVCLGDDLIPGASETIGTLREMGKRTVFLSNNTTRSSASYAEHLSELGIETQAEDVVNSTLVMIDFLARTIPGARLLVIGEDPFIRDLESAGFRVTAKECAVDAVIASFDRAFSYAKLQLAFDAIRAGAHFFATNNDRYRPVLSGGEPDAAAIIAAIEACTGKACEQVVGKPSHLTVEYVRDKLSCSGREMIVIGDRLETDIQMGINAGISSALVLTGATSRETASASPVSPTYVLDNLTELLPT